MPPRSRRVLMFRQYCLSERRHDSQWIHSQISNTQMLINFLSGMQNTLQECKWERRTNWQWVIYGASSCSRRVRLLFSSSPSLSSLPDVSHPPWERQTEGFRSHLDAGKWESSDAVSDMITYLFFCTLSFGGFLLGFSTRLPSGFVILFILLFLSSFPLFLSFRLRGGLQKRVMFLILLIILH